MSEPESHDHDSTTDRRTRRGSLRWAGAALGVTAVAAVIGIGTAVSGQASGDVADQGRDFASQGRDFADQGRDFASQGRDFSDQGRDFADQGRDFADQGRDFASQGRDFAQGDAADRATDVDNPEDPFQCPEGQLPGIDQERFPESETGGAMTPEAAVHETGPSIDAEMLIARSMGEELAGAPVWLESEGQSFVAQQLEDGTWFASPAEVLECRTPPVGDTPSGA